MTDELAQVLYKVKDAINYHRHMGEVWLRVEVYLKEEIQRKDLDPDE